MSIDELLRENKINTDIIDKLKDHKFNYGPIFGNNQILNCNKCGLELRIAMEQSDIFSKVEITFSLFDFINFSIINNKYHDYLEIKNIKKLINFVDENRCSLRIMKRACE